MSRKWSNVGVLSVSITLCLCLGCGRNESVEEGAAETSDATYFNQVAKCNGKVLGSSAVSFAPGKKLAIEINFNAKRDGDFVFALQLEGDGNVILNSCSGNAVHTGDAYSIRCELDAPPEDHEDCVLRVYDTARRVVFSADLPVMS